MQLNAATLTAPTPAGTSLFSLIPTLDATPAASANSSAAIAQNFSAMLTEMIGPVTGSALTQVQAPGTALTQVQAPGAALTQVQALGTALTQVQAPGTALTQVQATGTALTQVQAPGTALAQVQATGTAPLAQVQGVVVPGVPPVAQVGETPQVQLGQPASISGLQPTAAREPQKTQSMLPVDPAMPGIPAAPVPENPQAVQNNETPQLQLPLSAAPESAVPQPATKAPAAKPANPPVDATLTVPVASPFEMASVLPAVTSLAETALQGTRSLLSKADEPATAPTAAELAAAQQPELERAFADVKSFELTVQNETAKPAALPTLAQQAAAATANPARQALVTTDPIANIQLQQLPPRVMPIPRVMSDVKTERGKSDSLLSSNDTTATSTPTGQSADLIRPVEQADQVLAAHYVEVPIMPHVQVVRTVAMEVGDPGSEVTIRLQARGGDLTLQLNSGNEPLRQDLESSVGTLVNSLKQAQIQVSNVDVSRKSPLDKVRRMKEAR
jgi:hypothetical protein